MRRSAARLSDHGRSLALQVTMKTHDTPEMFLAADAERRLTTLRSTMIRLRRIAQGEGIEARLAGRIKSASSIARKTARFSCNPGQLQDIIGVRIIVPWTSNCYRMAKIIHDEFEILAGEDDDYIAEPKANGYRALHTTLLGRFHYPVEVQLRTSWMNDAAERGASTRTSL